MQKLLRAPATVVLSAGEAHKVTKIANLALLAAMPIGAAAIAIPVAAADPSECGVLWGDYCYTGDQQKAPPAAPSISWNEGLGSLTAHITDHSGVASQCTYASDLVNRSFSLPANGSFDVVIAPAVPAFRSWDVSVSCENGAVANTSKFY